jgi:Na+/proline symporter
VPHPDYALISAIQYVLPPFVWALFGVVVLAAVMSTTDRLLLTIGTLYSWDIHRKLINPGIDDKKLQKLSRLVVVGASILAFLAAINPPALLAWLIWMAIGLMLSTYCIPAAGGPVLEAGQSPGSHCQYGCRPQRFPDYRLHAPLCGSFAGALQLLRLWRIHTGVGGSEPAHPTGPRQTDPGDRSGILLSA